MKLALKKIKKCKKIGISKFRNKFFKLENEILLAGNSPNEIEKVVLPKQFNKSVVKAIHISNLHCGINKCSSIIKKEKIHLFSLNASVEEVIKHCIPCQLNKTKSEPIPEKFLRSHPSNHFKISRVIYFIWTKT